MDVANTSITLKGLRVICVVGRPVEHHYHSLTSSNGFTCSILESAVPVLRVVYHDQTDYAHQIHLLFGQIFCFIFCFFSTLTLGFWSGVKWVRNPAPQLLCNAGFRVNICKRCLINCALFS